MSSKKVQNLDYLVCSYSQKSLNRETNNEPNEDYLFFDKKAGVYLLADGVGGNPAGDLASNMAVQMTYMQLKDLHTELDNGDIDKSEISEIIKESVEFSNSLIYNTANAYNISKKVNQNIKRLKYEENNLEDNLLLNNIEEEIDKLNYGKEWIQSIQQMGTTLDVLFIYDKKAYTAHVGNGRIIQFGKYKQLKYQTTEQVTFQGDKPSNMDEWSVIESKLPIDHYVGQGKGLVVQSNSFDIKPKDIIYMFTDGVSHVLSEKEIRRESKNFLSSAKNIIKRTYKPHQLAKIISRRNYISLIEAKNKIRRKDDASIIGIKAYIKGD